MLNWILQYGPLLLAGLATGTGSAIAMYAGRKIFKFGKKVEKISSETKAEIQITKEGIIEAFKTANIPTDWKISVSNQLTEQLNNFKNAFIADYEKREAEKDKMLLLCIKILANTQSAGKLSEADKIAVNNIIAEITEKDSTIDITV